MPFNPTTGVYTAPENSWNPAVAGTVIDPEDWNATQADYVDALNQGSPTFDVTFFGATGDGVTDDSAAIQRAVNAAFAATNGGLVYFPAGTYIIGAQVVWPKTAGKYVICKGDGDASTIKNAAGFIDYMFYIGSAVAAGTVNISVRDIQFVGVDIATARAIKLENANTALLNRVSFRTVKNAVEMASSFAVRFSECLWSGISTYGIISTTAAHHLVVDGCWFFNIGASTTGTALKIDAASDNIVVQNCDLEVGYTGVQLDGGGSSFKFTGNYIEQFSNLPVFFSSTHYGADISNNQIAMGGTYVLHNMAGGRFVANKQFNQAITFPTTMVSVFVETGQLSGTSTIPVTGAGRLVSGGVETTAFLSGRSTGVMNTTAGASIVAGQNVGSWGVRNASNVVVAGWDVHYQNNADGGTTYMDGYASAVKAMRLWGDGYIDAVTGFKVNGTNLAASNLSNGVTGSGAIVLATSPTLVTPNLGVATATSVNKVAITPPATSATLTLANGSSLITSGAFSTTFTVTGPTTVTLPTSGTLATTTHSRQTISGCTGSNLAAGATQFFVTGISNFESLSRNIAAVSGTFRNLYIALNTAPGAGQSYTFTLRVNGADTGVTCTISDAATTGSDLSNTAAITAGQTWSIKSVSSAGAAGATPTFAVEFFN